MIFLALICLDLHMSTLDAAPFRISESPAPAELLGKYFRGLGDPTRLRLIELLAEGEEYSVGELVERVGVAQPAVSKHLGCLRWCGFVASRREHRTVYYRLADPRVSELLGIGRALLADNAEHVAACGVIDEAC
jgi:ArsR family transcriptional regulator, cadmium/lead-responsive transcriptional repressor